MCSPSSEAHEGGLGASDVEARPPRWALVGGAGHAAAHSRNLGATPAGPCGEPRNARGCKAALKRRSIEGKGPSYPSLCPKGVQSSPWKSCESSQASPQNLAPRLCLAKTLCYLGSASLLFRITSAAWHTRSKRQASLLSPVGVCAASGKGLPSPTYPSRSRRALATGREAQPGSSRHTLPGLLLRPRPSDRRRATIGLGTYSSAVSRRRRRAGLLLICLLHL